MEILADLTTPVSLFNRCIGDKKGFLLESVDRGEHWGRWSFIGGEPLASVSSMEGKIQISGTLPFEVNSNMNLLDLLTELWNFLILQ